MTSNAHTTKVEAYGTFKGVFLPTLLSVFGVVMFLRMGWMVGQVGLFTTTVAIALSLLVATLTALSISATVTNMRVGGGGAYFIVSRSLGIEIGTALGLLLYLAQSLGIAFYLAGFSESLAAIFPGINPRIAAVGALVILGVAAFRSAAFMVKVQLPIFLTIAGGLLSFYLGSAAETPVVQTVTYPENASFWKVLAVYFPAVTGIIAGIGLSGQLKSPSKSLPLGMLSALAVAGVVFLSIPFVLSGRVSVDVLQENMLIMGQISIWQPLLIAGLWCAALSSAISAFLGAPQILRALAYDRVLPRYLGHGFRSSDPEPRVATSITFVIALIGVTAGDLNAIAPVLAMIYLTAFVTLNFSAGIESLIKSPSWRPTFRVPASLSLLGAFLSAVIMLMIDAGSGLLAIAATMGIYYFMLRRKMQAHWGDARQGILMLVASYAVQRLQEFRMDPHSWKPHFLVMIGSPGKSWPLVSFVDHLNQDSGIVTYATVVPPSTSIERSRDMEQGIRGFLSERKVTALVRAIPAPHWQKGCVELISYYGLGKLQPDTLVLGIPSEKSDQSALAEVLSVAAGHGRNVLLLRLDAVSQDAAKDESDWQIRRLVSRKKATREIFVWWGGKKHNASLMIALGYLLQAAREWDDAGLVFQSVVQHGDHAEEALQRLNDFVVRSRIEARTNVVVTNGEGDILDVIVQESRAAAMTFLGVRAADKEESAADYADYLAKFIEATRPISNLALVMAGDEIRLARLFR